jgi:hypothetical protein
MPVLNPAIGSTDQSLFNNTIGSSATINSTAVDLGNRLSATSTSGGPRHARASGVLFMLNYDATTSSLTFFTEFSPDGGTTYYRDYEYTQTPLTTDTVSNWEVPFIAWCESHARVTGVNSVAAVSNTTTIKARLSGPRRVTV